MSIVRVSPPPGGAPHISGVGTDRGVGNPALGLPHGGGTVTYNGTGGNFVANYNNYLNGVATIATGTCWLVVNTTGSTLTLENNWRANLSVPAGRSAIIVKGVDLNNRTDIYLVGLV